jgi:hypothetical protein
MSSPVSPTRVKIEKKEEDDTPVLGKPEFTFELQENGVPVRMALVVVNGCVTVQGFRSTVEVSPLLSPHPEISIKNAMHRISLQV